MKTRLHLLLAFSLGLGAAVLYWPTLNHGFVFDDLWSIQQNEAHQLESLDLDSLARAGRGAQGMGNRPVSNLSFALNHYISGPQPSPRAYRWTNLLIHGANAALVYGIFLLTLTIAVEGGGTRGAGLSRVASLPARSVWSLLAAVLWLAHPIQTQAVTYLHQRTTSLASLFFLGSLLAYILGRRADSRSGRLSAFLTAAVCAALALASKEIAALLPMVVVLYEWTFFQGLRISWWRERWIFLAFAVLLVAGVTALYLGETRDWIEWMYSQLPYSIGERLLTQARVVVFGLSLLLLPHPARLNVDHDLVISTSLVDPSTTLPALATLVVLVGVALYCARRGRRLAFFGLLWILGTQLIESSVIPVEMVAEHRWYLPSVGLFLILLELAAACRRWTWTWLWTATAGVAVLFCVWTLERNQVWRDGVSLWTDATAKSPLKVRPRNNLGRLLAERGETGQAIEHFRRVLRLQPSHPEANANLGRALLERGETRRAIGHLLAASQGKEDLFEAKYGLGQALLRAGHHRVAADWLSRALVLRPASADAHYELGNALRLQGNVAEAEWHYLFALERSPEHVRRHYQLADQLFERGDLVQAMLLCETILTVQPENAVVHTRLALALAAAGELEAARLRSERALELDPQLESARRLFEALAAALEEKRGAAEAAGDS